MKKSKLNLILDALLLLCIAAIGGIGFLMKYVLVPGYLISTVADLQPKCRPVLLGNGPPRMGNDSSCDRIRFLGFACTPYRSALGNACQHLPDVGSQPFWALCCRGHPCLFDYFSANLSVLSTA